MPKKINLELLEEEMSCLYMLCDIARAYKHEHVFYKSHSHLIDGLREQLANKLDDFLLDLI